MDQYKMGSHNDAYAFGYSINDQLHDMKLYMRFCKNDRNDPLLSNVLKQMPYKMCLHRKVQRRQQLKVLCEHNIRHITAKA
jgi:hypothetical protein